MKQIDGKSKDFLVNALESFFSKKDAAEFIKIFLTVEELKTKPRSISSTNKEQINVNVSDKYKINTQIDLLITFAEAKLSQNKLIELLLLLGQFTITTGELYSAIYIHKRILNETRNESSLSNLSARAAFALGEIYSRQAIWKSSFDFTKQAYDSFKKINDLKGCANCENLLGTIYGELGNLSKAKRHFETSLSFLENFNDNALKGKLEINLGIIYNILGDFENAISYYRRALVNFEKIKDLKRIAEIRHNMGMLYTKKNQLSAAIQEFDRCIATAMQTGYIFSLGLAYLSKAFIYSLQNDFYLAEAFADKAMEICHQINDKLSIADIYKIKGIIQRKLRKYELSENYLLTSIRLNKELQNELNQAESNFELGILYIEMKRLDESKTSLTSSLKYYKKIKAVNEIKSINEMLKNLV